MAPFALSENGSWAPRAHGWRQDRAAHRGGQENRTGILILFGIIIPASCCDGKVKFLQYLGAPAAPFLPPWNSSDMRVLRA